MTSTGQRFGQSLPDQVDRISALFDAHLELIGDVRELYRDRAALEREYAGKLQLLVKKATEKKIKLEASFVVGDQPTKAWDSSSLMQNSLNTAYTVLMDSMVTTAQDHVNIADSLTSQVVDVLKAVERRNDEAKKKEIQFFQKLLSDRDRVFADRLKSKQKYDEECNEVESYRQKQSRSLDDKHADRVAKQAEQQRTEMLNSKNAYLISVAVANNTKTQFYDTNLPNLEDQFQLLQSRLVERFTKILQHSQTLQLGHLDSLKSHINRVETVLGRVDPSKDQDFFIDHNIRPFTATNDWTFEPCVGHYDTPAMSVEPAPKIFLQNKLGRCRSKLEDLGPLIDAKRREQEQLLSEISSYKADHTLGSIDEVSDNFLEVQHQLTFYTTSERILQAEVDAIVSAIGDDEGDQRPHAFKSSTFSIPTQCGYCKTSIWGLSKQGKTCKLCGISVHAKCELKIPADCQQQTSIARTQSSIRQSASVSRTSSRATQPPTASSFVQSVTSSGEPSEDSYPVARVLFSFTPTSEFELSVSEGAIVHVVEPDDGSGWVKVSDAEKRDGLVPASYLEHDSSASAKQALVTRGGSGQYVHIIYSYEAQGQDELDLIEGETIELTSGPSGGQNYGNGWWEGVNSTGRKGIFPSNYVELA